MTDLNGGFAQLWEGFGDAFPDSIAVRKGGVRGGWRAGGVARAASFLAAGGLDDDSSIGDGR